LHPSKRTCLLPPKHLPERSRSISEEHCCFQTFATDDKCGVGVEGAWKPGRKIAGKSLLIIDGLNPGCPGSDSAKGIDDDRVRTKDKFGQEAWKFVLSLADSCHCSGWVAMITSKHPPPIAIPGSTASVLLLAVVTTHIRGHFAYWYADLRVLLLYSIQDYLCTTGNVPVDQLFMGVFSQD